MNTGNPKHADIFLVTGSVNAQNVKVLRTLYEQMPEPRVVVAVGICATSGCVFRECYNVMGGVDTVLPVDVYVPGCAARPESIIDGIIQAVGLLEKKHAFMKSMHGRPREMIFGRAVPLDAPEILALQKIVYQNEAELYDDWSLTPLKQTLEEMRADFAEGLHQGGGGRQDHRLVRGYMVGDTGHVTRLIVHPYFWRRGIGAQLVQAMEAFPRGAGYQTFMGQKSLLPWSPTRSSAMCRSGRRRFPSNETACTSRGRSEPT